MFKKFSERIRDTIAEYRKSRDENVYLASMKKMADDLQTGLYWTLLPIRNCE